MLFVQLLPAVLSLLVLGAHFYRRGDLLFVGLALLLLGFFFVRRRWAAGVLQIALVLGAAEWLRTLLVLARFRADLGLPYSRLIVILGAVAAVALLSLLAFRSRRARIWYGQDRTDSADPIGTSGPSQS